MPFSARKSADFPSNHGLEFSPLLASSNKPFQTFYPPFASTGRHIRLNSTEMPRQAGGRPPGRTPSRPGKKTSISNRSGGDKRSPRSTRSSTVSQVSKIYGSIIRAPEWANPHLTQQRLRQSLDDISYRVNRWRTRFRGLISRVRLRTERPRRWSSKRI